MPTWQSFYLDNCSILLTTGYIPDEESLVLSSGWLGNIVIL